MAQFLKPLLIYRIISVYLALVMAKKFKYSLTMEYSPEEDQLEFIEERIDKIEEDVKRIQIEELTLEELMDFLEDNKGNIAIA